MIIGFPLYWKHITQGMDAIEGSLVFQQIRNQSVEHSNEGAAFSLIKNFDILSQFVAIIAVYEDNGSRRHRIRSAIAILVAMVYGSAGGAKGNVVTLMVQLFFVVSLKKGKINWRMLLVTGCLVVGFFGMALMWVNYAYMDIKGESGVSNLLVETIQSYWVGGLVSFNRLVQNPQAIPLTQPIYRFFMETARSLGMAVTVPSINAEYTMISPTMDTNVYTLYYGYFCDFGWPGVILIMSGLGAGLTWLYQRVRPSTPIALIFYSQMCIGIVFSFGADHFFMGLNSHIKFIVMLYVLYVLLPKIRRKQVEVGSLA
jgi:oligosaccharide repeat unit polymerase